MFQACAYPAAASDTRHAEIAPNDAAAALPIETERRRLLHAASAADVRFRLALAALLAVAALLRLPGITDVGVRFCDGSRYAGDARLWHRCARTLVDPAAWSAAATGDKGALKERMDAHGVDFSLRYTKPCQGFTALVAMMMFIVGDDPSAVAVTNAWLDVLTVALTAMVGAALGGRRVALMAAALMAVSPFALLYARSDLADASATFFVMAGLWLWLPCGECHRPRFRRLLCGMALGYAVTCHFRTVSVPAFLMAAETWVYVVRRLRRDPNAPSITRFLRSSACFGMGVAGPTLAIEGVFQSARLAALLSDSFLPLMGFTDAASRWWAISVRDEGDLAFHSVVGRALWDHVTSVHGVAFAVLALAGLALAVRRGGPIRIVAGLALVTLVALLFQRNAVARLLASIFPLVCLGVSVAAWSVIDGLGRFPLPKAVRAGVAAALAAWLAVPAVQSAHRLASTRSSVKDACRWLIERGGPAVVPQWAMYALYLDDAGVPVIAGEAICEVASPEATLADLKKRGVRWMVTDPQHWHHGPATAEFRWWNALNERLAAGGPPAAQFTHMADYRREFLAEGPGPWRLPAMTAAGAGPIRIYDLQASP